MAILKNSSWCAGCGLTTSCFGGIMAMLRRNRGACRAHKADHFCGDVVVREQLAVCTSRAKPLDFGSLMIGQSPDRFIGDNYQCAESLGAGSFGDVFRATSSFERSDRAIKRIPKSSLKQDMDVICGEIRALMRLQHRNVMKLYDFFEDVNTVYLVTELCTGGDFSSLPGTLPLWVQRKLYKELFMALAFCHSLGIIHRDIKPRNCLIHCAQGGELITKVIDFGAAALRPARLSDANRREWLCDVQGTKYFVAPEVADVTLLYGDACDLWSAGVTLYIIETGEHPCAADATSLDTARLLDRIVEPGPLRWSPLLKAGVSADMGDLLGQLLVKDPLGRISAQEALEHYALCEEGCAPERQLERRIVERLTSYSRTPFFERLLLALAAHVSGPEYAPELWSAFCGVDASKNGTLSREELRQAAKSACDLLPADEIDRVFDVVDLDGSGRILYSEWLAATVCPSVLCSDAVVDSVYDFLDVSRTGEITEGDLSRVLGWSSEEARSCVRRSISKSDFAELLRRIGGRTTGNVIF